MGRFSRRRQISHSTNNTTFNQVPLTQRQRFGRRFAMVAGVLSLLACGIRENESSHLSSQVRGFEGEQGMKIGAGFSTVDETVRGDCIVFDSPRNLGTGQETQFQMQLLESHNDLAFALGISSASQIKVTQPEMSVSAKTKYAFGSNFTLNKYSVFLLVSAQVKNETMLASNVRLKEDIRAALMADPDKGIDQFRVRCGDAFISGYTTGGEFQAVIEIETDSTESKLSAAAEISAAVGIEGLGDVGGESKIESALTRVARNHKVKVWTYQRGGSGSDSAAAATVDEMLTRARRLPEIVAMNGRALTATFTDYATLDLALSQSYLNNLRRAERAVTELGSLQGKLFDARANIDFVMTNPNAFRGLTAAKMAELTRMRTEILIRGKKTQEAAIACFEDYKTCAVPTGLTVPEFSEPVRIGAGQGALGNKIAVDIKPQSIRRERIGDWFSGPECYVEITAVTTKRYIPLVRTEIFNNCDIPDLVKEISISRIQEAFTEMGGDVSSGWIDVDVYEADEWGDDYLGTASSTYFSSIQTNGSYETTLSNDWLLMGVGFTLR